MGKLGKIIGKCISYPIIGNLSPKLQDRFQNLIGRENYNKNDAFYASVAFNLAGYFALGCLDYAFRAETSGLPGIGLFYGALEGGIGRQAIRDMNQRKSCASLPGKIVSIPLEIAVRGYDSIRNLSRKGNLRF